MGWSNVCKLFCVCRLLSLVCQMFSSVCVCVCVCVCGGAKTRSGFVLKFVKKKNCPVVCQG